MNYRQGNRISNLELRQAMPGRHSSGLASLSNNYKPSVGFLPGKGMTSPKAHGVYLTSGDAIQVCW